MSRLFPLCLALVGLLAACAPDGRPLDDYLADEARRRDAMIEADAAPADASPEIDAGPASDAGPPPVCSAMTREAVIVRFTNNTARDLTLHWVDFECAEVFYFDLAAGDWRIVDTFVGHAWRLRDAETGALVYDFPGAPDAEPVHVRIP